MNNFCPTCGSEYPDNKIRPLTCAKCNHTVWFNPKPGVCIMVPFRTKLIGVRRNIEPHKGGLALPGGYMELGEDYKTASSREMFEETGLFIPPEKFSIHSVESDETNLLLFVTGPMQFDEPVFVPNPEVQELVYFSDEKDICFPIQRKIVGKVMSQFLQNLLANYTAKELNKYKKDMEPVPTKKTEAKEIISISPSKNKKDLN